MTDNESDTQRQYFIIAPLFLVSNIDSFKKEKFEDTKWAFKKLRQCNGRKKRDKPTNKDRRNTTQKITEQHEPH